MVRFCVISIIEKGKRENGGKGTGNKKHNWYLQNRWDVKNSIGNGEAKEFICMMHGHELMGGMLEGMGVPGGGAKGEKVGQQ